MKTRAVGRLKILLLLVYQIEMLIFYPSLFHQLISETFAADHKWLNPTKELALDQAIHLW